MSNGQLMVDLFLAFIILSSLIIAIIASKPPGDVPPGQNRPWFQLHLSTLMILVMFLSLVIRANVVSGRYEEQVNRAGNTEYSVIVEYVGWPFIIQSWYVETIQTVRSKDEVLSRTSTPVTPEPVVNILGITVNLLTTIFLAASLGSFCEHYIYWKKTNAAWYELIVHVNPLFLLALVIGGTIGVIRLFVRIFGSS